MGGFGESFHFLTKYISIGEGALLCYFHPSALDTIEREWNNWNVNSSFITLKQKA